MPRAQVRRIAAISPLRPIARACALLCLGSAALHASAQTAARPPTLGEVTVRETAQTPDRLPEAAPGGKVAKGSQLGILGNVDALDAPFSTTAYTAEGIADQQAPTVGAVLRHDPSVRTSTNEGHIVENFVVRGFPVGSAAMAIGGLYGLAPEQNTPVEMFERVELIKGPSAMLMGLPPTGDVGGAVNLVPKRAGAQALTRLTTTWSSKSNLQGHLDFARRLGEDQRLGVRFNGVFSGGETWLDGQTRSRRIAHLGLDYRGNGWKVESDIYSLSNRNRKGSPMQVVLNGWTTAPKAPDGSTNFFYGNDVYSNTDTRGVIVKGTLELGAGWTGFASAGTAKHSYDGFIFGTRPVWAAANADSGDATGTAYNSWGEYESRTVEVGVRGQFVTGPLAHRLTVAATVFQYEGGSRGNGTAPIVSNIFDPSPITMPAGAAASTFTRLNDDEMSALSVVDTLSTLDDKVQLTLGARAQRVRQKIAGYDETAVTPVAGVVFKPWGADISLYGNYIEGLSAGTVVKVPYVNAGEAFTPYRSRQAELGVKWRSGGITQSLALFQIEKPALIVEDNAQRPDGEQRNRGLEWMVSGELARGLSVLGGVAYTTAVQTRTAGGVNQGRNVLGVPRWTLNLGADWEVPGAPGLALSGRVNHTGSQWLTANNSSRLPGWTTLDLGARYSTRWGSQPVVLRAQVTNLTDKAYFEGVWGADRLNLGAPRAFSVAAQFDF